MCTKNLILFLFLIFKNEAVKAEPGQPEAKPNEKGQPPTQMSHQRNGGAPRAKKMKLEQMGFGNMGSGFGCSLFVPNQGEEMPTMLQMGYAGEAPGMGFGDDDEVSNDVKLEKMENFGKSEFGEAKPVLGKVGKVGEEMMSVNKSDKKAEWPPALMDYISRAFSSCRNDTEKDKTEKYLKNILNGRLKSGSAYEIDWENEPLPKVKNIFFIKLNQKSFLQKIFRTFLRTKIEKIRQKILTSHVTACSVLNIWKKQQKTNLSACTRRKCGK